MKATHQHEWEASPGLPQQLPAGEHVIWQGRPQVGALAVHAFHLKKVALYFLLMLAWQGVVLLDDSTPSRLAVEQLAVSLALIVAALLMLFFSAWWSAHTTLYTLTNRRVVMRIGIVLSVTFNLPYRQIAAAHLKSLPQGAGDVALELASENRIGWFHLWPHQRAWHVKHPQPTLRCIAQAQQVSEVLQQAWQAAQESGAIRQRATTPADANWQSQPA